MLLGYLWPKWLLDRNDVTYNKDDLELHDDEMGMFRDEECGKPKGVVRVERFKTAKPRKKEVISSSEAGASSAQVRDVFDNVRGKVGLNFKTSEDGDGKQQMVLEKNSVSKKKQRTDGSDSDSWERSLRRPPKQVKPEEPGPADRDEVPDQAANNTMGAFVRL